MAYTTATLTGTYLKTDGTPAEGTVEIIPNSTHLVDAEGDVILAGRVKVTLDGTGSFTVTLPATDDPTVEPATGRQYTFVAKLRHTHLAAITGVELPGGTTVDVADVASLPVVDPAVTLAATPAQLAALENTLTAAIAGKQDAGDYATPEDLATKADVTALDTLAPYDTDPLQPLDLWEGLANLTTLPTYMAAVDATLNHPSVTKTDRGTCSNGVDHVWSYRAGTGARKALIVSGIHGDEILGCYLGLRWFEWFATGTDPIARTLRTRLTVEWVACANPDGYNTAKENNNGVNVNRNFGFYWPGTQSPETAGTAAFSEVESQIVRDIVDEGYLCVIDIHGRGPVGTNNIGYAPASAYTLSDRALVNAALDVWAESYADLGGGADILLIDGEPTCSNWAAHYGRWDGTGIVPAGGPRRNNAALLLEIATDQHGSTATSMSADAARQLCGFLTVYLGLWLQAGQVEPTPYPMLTRATGPKTTGTSVTVGGNRMDTSTWGKFVWSVVSPTSGGTATDEIRFVTPYPCDVKVTVEGYARYSGTAGGTTFRGSVGISLDNATAPDASSMTTFSVESTDANRNVPFQSTMRFQSGVPDGATVRVARAWFQRNAGGTADIVLCRAFVELVPTYDSFPHATIRQGA